jgi:HK97 family phage major capsid protein
MDMTLSKNLKRWLVANAGVKATADEATFQKAAADAMVKGDLTVAKYTELVSESDAEATEFAKSMQTLATTLQGVKDALVTKMKDEDEDEDEEEEEDEEGEEDPKARLAKLGKSAKGQPTKTKAVASEFEKMVTRIGGFDNELKDGESVSVRVKEAAEAYSDTKSTLTYPSHTKQGKPHPFAGRPVVDFSEGTGRTMDSLSDRDKAVSGAFAKFLVNKAVRKSASVAFQTLPQHDRELLTFAMEKMTWGGSSDGSDRADIVNRKLTHLEQKSLIDDATSGGIEAAPVVFDDNVIQTPLLYGELFPLVNQIPLDRGRRVEGVATGTVTGGWGGVDATAVTLFNTASYVSAFDTTVFRWEGALRIGLDFLSDTPIDFGAHVTAQYGERLLQDLDNVIATGNGSTQPEGIMNKSGATSVSWGGATSIGNYESLRFGVAKAEHRSTVAATAVFCGTETSYMRARAIPVGSSDARRLGSAGASNAASGYGDYTWMDRPYKINESLENTEVFYAILARYRMYRRRGLAIRTSTEGDTLIRQNAMLMVAMARYGGQMERGACIARTTTAPA